MNLLKIILANRLLEDIEWLKIIEQGFKINTIFSEEMESWVILLKIIIILKVNMKNN